MTGKHI